MAAIGRMAHVWAAGLFAVGVVVQAFLAGIGLAQLGGSGDFSTHAAVGYSVMGILALAVPITAALGRLPSRQLWSSLGLLVLYVVQTALPAARGSSPVIAALHPANAMLLLLVAVMITLRARTLSREARTA
jgi:hypothetical protein